MRRDQVDYADAVGEAAKRQLLLNLVKLRYGDTPNFLTLSQLVAGYTVEGRLSLGGDFDRRGWAFGEDFDVSTETAREDAITIINTWGVGRAGIDDGLVVLFDMDNGSTSHGQIYLYAGRGFEDRYLNRDELSTVVDDAMLPLAQDGDIDGALLAGLDRVDHAAQTGGNPDRAGQTLLLVALGAIFAVLAIVLDGSVALVASRARDLFASSPRRLERMGGAGGLMMVGLGTGLLFSGRAD